GGPVSEVRCGGRVGRATLCGCFGYLGAVLPRIDDAVAEAGPEPSDERLGVLGRALADTVADRGGPERGACLRHPLVPVGGLDGVEEPARLRVDLDVVLDCQILGGREAHDEALAVCGLAR